MVPIFIVLLLFAWVAEPKIVYFRPTGSQNNTATNSSTTSTTSTTTTTTTTMATTAATENSEVADKDDGGNKSNATVDAGEPTGNQYADSDKSMSSKNYFGVQYYAPPVIHGPATAVNIFGRHLHHQHTPAVTNGYYRTQQQQQHHQHQIPWQPTAPVFQQEQRDDSILQINSLLSTAADNPSAAQYSGSRPLYRRPSSMARVNYAEPLGVLPAETDNRPLPEDLPGIQFAIHRGNGKHQTTAATPGIYQQQRHSQRLPPPPPTPPPPPHSPQMHRLQQPQQHHYHYAPTRITQVPFLYNLPAPPPAQRQLAPAEYELVSQFNRLIKQHEKEKDQLKDEDDDETVTRPAVKPKKATKRKKKKKKRQRTTISPLSLASAEEDINEKNDKQKRNDDDLFDNEQLVSEEQESQNVPTSEKLPEEMELQENDTESPNVPDEPALISEQFGGDLTFEDGDGERVEFQLHGISGPESYKFGFDTGKGTNRQFRYEERDSHGNVRGHYGYLDGEGKMQVYNYSSHPVLGFQAQKSETFEV